MAFVSGNSPDQSANTDQEKDKDQMADQAPITSAPAGGGGPGKPSGQASSKGPSQPFTNLSAYLGANGSQVEQMGSDIAGKLGSDYAATSGAIDSARDGYGKSVSQGYTPYDQSLVDSFSANPASVAADPTKASQFKGMYNDRYTGPGNFQDTPEYADLSGKVQKSQAFAGQVSTVPGLQSYLSSQSPTYTQGQSTLDSALLQTNPNAVQTVAAAAKPFQNLPGYLEQTTTNGNAMAANASQQAQQAKTAAQKAAGDYTTNFANTQNDQMSGYAKQATDYNTLMNSATAKLNSGKYADLTPEEQKLVGFNPAATSYMQKYPDIFASQAQAHPIDFSSYFTSGDQARMPTSADVFSPDELANYKALVALTGQGGNLNFDAPEQGTEGSFHMPGNMPSFNNVQALTAINSAYSPMYDQVKGTPNASQGTTDYMEGLRNVLNGTQPSPTPTTPMPTDKGLGNGYHWDANSGGWVVNIPLQPTAPPPSGDGKHVFF